MTTEAVRDRERHRLLIVAEAARRLLATEQGGTVGPAALAGLRAALAAPAAGGEQRGA